MSRKVTLIMTLMIVLIGTLTLAFNIQRAECSEPPPTEWTKTYGGAKVDYAYSIVNTSDGGYALAGWTDSFGAGSYDFWLIKVDEDGTLQWNKTYGGTDVDEAFSVVATDDGGYALAGFTDSFGAGSSDAWLVKVDSSGDMEWNKTYGGGGEDWTNSVVETSDGGYALAGYTDSFGEGNYDFWLVKVDSSGNHEWNKTYGGAYEDVAHSVVETCCGYALAGYTFSYVTWDYDFWLIQVDSSGNMEWNQTYGGDTDDSARSVVETSDGGYALAGSTNSFGAGDYDFWLVKTNSYGGMEWNRTYGGANTDRRARCIAVTGDEGYALAGWTDSFGSGSYDFWLVKVDSSGNMEWNQTYGGADVDRADSVVETSDGGYALAGGTRSSGAGSTDAWLVKVAGDQTPDDDGPTPDDNNDGEPNPDEDDNDDGPTPDDDGQTPDDDSGLSVFYIGLAITIILAIVATAVFVKLKKKRRKKETINLPFSFLAFL